MFKTYGELIANRALVGHAQIQEGVALRFYCHDSEVRLPLGAAYIAIPNEGYTGVFPSGSFVDYTKVLTRGAISIDSLKISKNLPSDDSLKNNRFDYWPLFIGLDKSHHDFTQWASMLIEDSCLQENMDKRIEESEFLASFLRMIDELPVVYLNGEQGRRIGLEQKIHIGKTPDLA